MIKLISIPVVLSLLIAPACIFAQATQQPAPKSETGTTTSNGVITGKVLDDHGQPISNAMVSVRAVGSSGQGQSVTSDREGAFQATGLVPASYMISASMPAYTVPPRDPSITPATTYRVGDSVTLTLVKGGVVTGTVTNSNGDPVIAVSVRAQMIRDANGRRVQNTTNVERVTDDRGVYRIYGLPTGTYVVLAGGPNTYSPSPLNPFELDVPTYAPSSTRDTAAEISVRAGEETAGVDITYRGETGRVVSGQVNPGQDTTLGFNVTLTAAGDAIASSSNSTYQPPGVRGFSFNGVADGDYYLFALSYSPTGDRVISLSKRITVRGADVTGIELITKPLAAVTGRVVLEESKAPECTDKARPLFSEMLVSAWHNDNEAAKQLPQFVWSFGAPVPPDAEGNFNLRHLAPGQYYFVTRFQARYWYIQSIAFAPTPVAGAKAGKPVDATRVWTNIKPGDRLSGLTVTLAQGSASLRGQLVLGEGEQVPERLFVYLAPMDREKADDLLRFYAASVAPDGKIALNNIAPGRYWILPQVYGDDAVPPITKLRLPHETETRAKLRREAEAAKTEIEFKPCQNITEYQLPLKPKDQ